MNAISRVCLTLNAHINSLIDQVENHEAVAEAAINDIREALANTVFQLKRLQDEQGQMNEKVERLRVLENKLMLKAVKLEAEGGKHEEAIECVRKLKATRDEIAAGATQIGEHQQLANTLSEDIRRIQLKFNELKSRRAKLAARSSRSQALETLNQQNTNRSAAGVFDRWERSVLRSEIGASVDDAGMELTDELTATLVKETEREDLEKMLEELRSTTKF